MTEQPVVHSTFAIERSYATSPARVFAAFADPALKCRCSPFRPAAYSPRSSSRIASLSGGDRKISSNDFRETVRGLRKRAQSGVVARRAPRESRG